MSLADSHGVPDYWDMENWIQLDAKWQHAMRAALEAYLNGSAPIGAIVFDASNQVVARGKNNFAGERLAHAEMEALRGVPSDKNRAELSLYSTMEPCPMCTGAIRMMQLKSLHFATKDPAAGSTELLRMTPFMRHFECEVFGPTNLQLQFVNVALTLEYRTRNGHSRWRDNWYSYLPSAVETGERFVAEQKYSEWAQDGASAESLFDEVCSYVR